MKSVLFSENPAAWILEQARFLGFDQAGISALTPLNRGKDAIAHWVREGRHGSMKYLEDFEERQQRFFSEFSGALSVIVLGVNYYQEFPGEVIDSDECGSIPFGRVARYAWGKDYHSVIRDMHADLIEKISQQAGSSFRAVSCIDTQPLPERYAAAQAGLGFIGKHTNLLNSQFGPWLFLSEIVTNLDLKESLPASGNCGTCTHCQTICPTGALDEDYRMDARRCIAYLTIEHKGIIPREFRSQIKNWIFGCDECLDICPFTSKSKPSQTKGFDASQGVGAWISIQELFEINSQGQYEKRFRGTPLLRASRKQLMRNACVVLGNSGKREAVPYLERALKDLSPLVRLHAAWALGNLPQAEALVVLERALPMEKDTEVLREIQESVDQKKGAN